MIGATDLFHPSPAPHLKTFVDPDDKLYKMHCTYIKITSKKFLLLVIYAAYNPSSYYVALPSGFAV